MKTIATPRPYATSIEHLREELEGWVTARCFHLAAQKELAAAEAPPTGRITVVGQREPTASEELRRRIAKLAAIEDQSRALIDARIEATKAVGTDLGLDRLCKEYDLDRVERTALVLCFCRTVPGFAVEPLEQIGLYGINDVTIDFLARFCDLDFTAAVGLRLAFGAEGRLVQAGLVAVDLGYSAGPSDWPSASLHLTTRGWSAVTGIRLPADTDE